MNRLILVLSVLAGLFLTGCLGDKYELVKSDIGLYRINKANGDIFRVSGDVLSPVPEEEIKKATSKKEWDTLKIAYPDNIEVMLFTRWKDGNLYYRVSASPYKGRLAAAREKYGSELTINFYDEYGFELTAIPVPIASMASIVDLSGSPASLRFQGHIPMERDAYRDLEKWTCMWNF